MTTPLDIIKLSMRDAQLVGVGETPQAEDTNDAFRKLNWMLGEWAQQRWVVYHLVEKTILSNGTPNYTVGPAGDIVMSPRPAAIQSAVLEQTPVSGYPAVYPMEVLQAYEDYLRITVKTLPGPSMVVFLDTDWPTATIKVWPVAQAGLYNLRFLFLAPLSQFTSLNETINLPPMYESALNWNLALRLSPMTGEGTVNPVIAAEAKSSLRLIRNVNAQIRRLKMPRGIVRGAYYDAMAGTWR